MVKGEKLIAKEKPQSILGLFFLLEDLAKRLGPCSISFPFQLPFWQLKVEGSVHCCLWEAEQEPSFLNDALCRASPGVHTHATWGTYVGMFRSEQLPGHSLSLYLYRHNYSSKKQERFTRGGAAES